jgi:hypothetical protein
MQNKSTLYCLGVTQLVKRQVTQLIERLQFKEGKFSIRYLGVFFYINKAYNS